MSVEMAEPAFPTHPSHAYPHGLWGMTLRDYFAAKALFLQLSNAPDEQIASKCYAIADAMLKTRGTPFTPEEDVLLFAAAPDLLDSLRDVLSLVDRGLLVRDTNMWNLETRSRLVAILSKAEQSVAKAEGK